LERRPIDIALHGTVGTVAPDLLTALPTAALCGGADRAAALRDAAWAALNPAMQAQVAILNAIRDACPGAIIVGDSTQAIYAGNLYYDHDRPAGWFNAATGFGALGYAIPAAVGAALACPDAQVIALAGDGGAQFTLPEIMTAVDENLPITFVIWNNHAYLEIATSMERVGVTVTGCHPTPPDFAAVAASCGIPHRRVAVDPAALTNAFLTFRRKDGPVMIEIEDR
jgi:acetolactate synthase-1/2/3 large subunit